MITSDHSKSLPILMAVTQRTSADKMLAFTQALPKLELHAHLHGSIRMSTLRDLLVLNGVFVPRFLEEFVEREDLRAKSDCVDVGDVDVDINPQKEEVNLTLTTCFTLFALIHSAVTTTSALKRVIHEVLTDFANDGVVYCEIRSTPRELFNDDEYVSLGAYERNSDSDGEGMCNVEDYVDIVLAEFRKFEDSHCADAGKEGLIPRFIVSLDRSKTVDCYSDDDKSTQSPSSCPWQNKIPSRNSIRSIHHAITLFKRHKKLNGNEKSTNAMSSTNYIVGADLGGNPHSGFFQTFQPLLSLCREAGMGCTIHCGEVECAGAVGFDDAKDVKENEEEEEEDEVKTKRAQKLQNRTLETSAILNFKPDRLGHCLYLSREQLEVLIDEKMVVEVCPSSNVLTLGLNHRVKSDNYDSHSHSHAHSNSHSNSRSKTVVNSLPNHPHLLSWLTHNHPICLSTDDPTVFSTLLSLEYYNLAVAFNLTLEEICCLCGGFVGFVFDGGDGGLKGRLEGVVELSVERAWKVVE